MRTHRTRTPKTDMVAVGIGAEYISGFLALPSGGGRHGGVVALHEWWGLNDWGMEQATNLAANGCSVFAVELYPGIVTTDPYAGRM